MINVNLTEYYQPEALEKMISLTPSSTSYCYLLFFKKKNILLADLHFSIQAYTLITIAHQSKAQELLTQS